MHSLTPNADRVANTKAAKLADSFFNVVFMVDGILVNFWLISSTHLSLVALCDEVPVEPAPGNAPRHFLLKNSRMVLTQPPLASPAHRLQKCGSASSRHAGRVPSPPAGLEPPPNWH